MNPHPVVEHFDVVEELIGRRSPRGEAFVMNHLTLQVAEETFRHRVIPAVTFTAHALPAAPGRQLFSETQCSPTGSRDHYGSVARRRLRAVVALAEMAARRTRPQDSQRPPIRRRAADRKSTRLNSSH